MYFIVTCEVDLEHFTWARLTLLNHDATKASVPPLTTCGWLFFDIFFRSGFSHLVYGLVFLSSLLVTGSRSGTSVTTLCSTPGGF